MRAIDRHGVSPLRLIESVQNHVSDIANLDAAVCAFLVIQAELVCLPTDSERWQAMRDQRDRLFADLDERQRAQLRWISGSLDALFPPSARSAAA